MNNGCPILAKFSVRETAKFPDKNVIGHALAFKKSCGLWT